ncbi:MAG: efflux RND transporter periplasmic adaptor subunit [Gallionella sp.]
MKIFMNSFGLLLVAFATSAQAASEVALSSQQIQTLGIVTASLPNKSSGEVSGLPAQVVVPGNQLFVMSSPLPGLVEQTLVGVGDSVKKGQIMATLQSPAYAEAQRGYVQASVQAQLAKDNLSRDEALFKDGIIAESRYRATKGAALEAAAALAERKQLLRVSGMSDAALAKLQAGNILSGSFAMTAPMDGVILEKSASAGQRLDAAVQIFKIAKLDPLALEIQVSAAMTRDLKVGATITIPAFNASGKLTAIGRGLTGSNQSILLRGNITHGAENLHPNQFVEVSIATDVSGGAAQWEIPNTALVRVDGQALIFVVTAKGFHAQNVVLKNEGAQNSVITGNLKGDEKIAVRGVSALKSSLMGIGGTQ